MAFGFNPSYHQGYNNYRQSQNGYRDRGYQYSNQVMPGHGQMPGQLPGRYGYSQQMQQKPGRQMQQMPGHQMQGRQMQQMQGRQMQQMPQQLPQQIPQQMPAPMPMNNMQIPAQAPQLQNAPQAPQPNIFQQPLPDGVTIQPLDEKTLASLKNIQPGQPLPNIEAAPLPEAAEPQVPAPLPTKTEPIFPLKVLEQLVQNEHNAGKFYQHLESVAPYKEYKTMLKDIVHCCNGRKVSLNSLYNNLSGANFNVAEREIDTSMSFREGVLRAIREESQGLRELATIYEAATDDKSARILNAQMTRKLGDITVLTAMYR